MENANRDLKFKAAQAARIMERESVDIARLGQVVIPDEPGNGKGNHSLYSFRNLVEMRLAEHLSRFGVPQKRIHKHIQNLRQSRGRWLEDSGAEGWVVLTNLSDWGAGHSLEETIQNLSQSIPVGSFVAVNVGMIKRALRLNLANATEIPMSESQEG